MPLQIFCSSVYTPPLLPSLLHFFLPTHALGLFFHLSLPLEGPDILLCKAAFYRLLQRQLFQPVLPPTCLLHFLKNKN